MNKHSEHCGNLQGFDFASIVSVLPLGWCPHQTSYKQILGSNPKGAQEMLNNVKNLQIPEGLSFIDLVYYRELAVRTVEKTHKMDNVGSEAIKVKILDYLIKNY